MLSAATRANQNIPSARPRPEVVHDEVRVVLGQHEQGDRHPVAEEEVQDGDDDERREQRSPVQPVEQQHSGEEDEAHVEVDLLEEGVDPVQPERVDADVERSGDGEHRARRQKPDPEPQLEREAARLGVLSEQHLDPVYRAEEHDREHEVRVVHLRVRDVPEGGETDVGRERGAHEDEHGPRHVKELRGVHGFSGGGACGLVGGAWSRAAGAHDLRASHGRERTGPRPGRSGGGCRRDPPTADTSPARCPGGHPRRRAP